MAYSHNFSDVMEQRAKEYFFQTFIQQPMIFDWSKRPTVPWHRRWLWKLRGWTLDPVANGLHRLSCRLGADCYYDDW